MTSIFTTSPANPSAHLTHFAQALTDARLLLCSNLQAQKRQLRYNGSSLRGCRQVVRPQLPKLVSAGSNPVTRSSALHGRRSQVCCGAFLRPIFYWFWFPLLVFTGLVKPLATYYACPPISLPASTAVLLLARLMSKLLACQTCSQGFSALGQRVTPLPRHLSLRAWRPYGLLTRLMSKACRSLPTAKAHATEKPRLLHEEETGFWGGRAKRSHSGSPGCCGQWQLAGAAA